MPLYRPLSLPLFLLSLTVASACGPVAEVTGEEVTDEDVTDEEDSALTDSLSPTLLRLSGQPDRSGATALQGATVSSERIFVHFDASARRLRGVSRVEFFLDDPQASRPPLRTDVAAPFDLGGTLADGSAGAFSVVGLTAGLHQLTVRVTIRERKTEWTTAEFTLQPASSCRPTTCAAQGKNCGQVSDGCGGTLQCGTCASPSTCGGGGTANVCGTPGTTTPEPSPTPSFPSTTLTCAATGATATQSRTVAGAVPNDGTDDREAIQAAIDAASREGGGIVRLPEGVFIVNGPVLVRSNVKLSGVGPKTVLKAGPQFFSRTGPFGGYPVVTTNGANNVTLADFTADQSGDVLDGNRPGRLNEYLVDVRYSRNAVVDGVFTRNPFTYSIAVVGSTDFCVRNSNTLSTSNDRYNQIDGIHILDSNTGHVLNNTVDQRSGTDGDDGLVAHTIGAPVFNVVYAGNRVRGGRHGAGMQLAFGNFPIHDLQIMDNEFWGSPRGIHNAAYEGSASVYNIVVGGSSSTGNLFRDNEGDAVSFSGDISNVTVTHNVACRSGGFVVGPGNGNVVRDNSTVCP